MHNGTLKTEAWTHFDDVGQEYFRFEIISRWWIAENGGMEWKHTIIRVDRDGSVSDCMKNEKNDTQIRDLRKLVESFVTTGNSGTGGSKERTTFADQHHQLVRITLG